MKRIRLLSENTVNRIAAGEVIERPAAAVKELVENAIDAGAGRIGVALAEGGIARIEVTDDGAGIAADDLALAVQRHATSKLDDDNLVRIATLGFRGEALPSIGAAARLAITSRTADAAHAATIRVEGGRVGAVEPASGTRGTRVVVTDMFFATPARRKFLKHPRTEADHAEAAVMRLAMAWPNIAFRLQSDGRTVFDLPAQTMAERVAALLGPEAAAALLPVEHTRGPLHVMGFIASPAHTRATSAAQYLVVNGRPVVDPVLRASVRVAYRDVIAPGRQPVVALFLDVPPEELDVNVHPAKTELRFRDGAGVRALVIGALRHALSVPAQAEEIGEGGLVAPRITPMPASHVPSAWRPAAGGYVHAPSVSQAVHGAPPGRGMAEARLDLAALPAARMLGAAEPSADHPLGASVAQILETYVLAVAADGALVIVDQHAAHERLTHEALAAQYRDGGVRTQPLLLPSVVEFSPGDAARLLAHAPDLEKLGLEIEEFGGSAVLVRALPAALGNPDPVPLLRDIADELGEMGESVALETKLDAVIARLACHGSIRAGRRLSQAEMDALLRQLETTPRATTCSHGRPTVLKLSRGELERMFGRG